MKVLLVNRQFGAGCFQGTERYLATLAEGLQDRGHEVSVLAGAAAGALGEQVDTSPPVFACPTRGWMSVVGLSPGRIEAWLREHRPDVVHLANPSFVGVGALRAARRLGIPVVMTIMDFWWVCPKATLLRADGSICDATPGCLECVRCLVADHARRYVRPLGRLPRVMSPLTLSLYFMRAALRGIPPAEMVRWARRRQVLLAELNAADRIIFPSRAVCDVISPRLSHDRWQVVPYGLSREWFESPKVTSGRDAETGPLTVGYAGAILPHKAPHLLLAAVHRLGWTDCRIRLAGPAEDRDYLDAVKAAGRDLDVEWLGPLPAGRMPAFLRSLDVLAMTSLWPENLPFVVLEAQAAGVPVVGSDVAGVAEQIAHRRLRFEPGSVEQLAAALAFVREHRHEGFPARISTAEEMTGTTEAVYGEAMARGTRRVG